MPKTIDSTAVTVREDFALSPQAEAERARYMPVMSMPQALERRDVVIAAITRLMREGEDFGLIPGAGNGKKKSLFQPGAQKLDNLFGLVPTYQIVDKELDWTGDNHGGEPFFNYEVSCILMRGDFQMGEGLGQCSSWESKYRWRKTERTCPACGKENIRKSKDGSWYCWKKTDGCGATFKAGDQAIEGQETGRKPNPDIHDQVNTILKMAEKRAHLLATINATSASEFLTQDVMPEPDSAEGQQETTAQVADRRIAEETGKLEAQRANGGNPPEVEQTWKYMAQGLQQTLDAFKSLKEDLYAAMGASTGETEYRRILGNYGVAKSNEFVKGPKASAPNARACAREMWLALLSAQQFNVTENDALEPVNA